LKIDTALSVEENINLLLDKISQEFLPHSFKPREVSLMACYKIKGFINVSNFEVPLPNGKRVIDSSFFFVEEFDYLKLFEK
jgi:hypothetical protein